MTAPDSVHGWIAASSGTPERELRQAVHTLLLAIGSLSGAGGNAVLKGGILLALGYGSDRFTRDVDFSTDRTPAELPPEALIENLRVALATAEQRLPYGLQCRIQHHELRPPSSASSWPTLKLKVGYAPQTDARRLRRLRDGHAAHTVSVDFSYNEVITGTELQQIGTDTTIRVASLSDLLAEKYRALLQQPIRDRYRRQDPFDLHLLLKLPEAHLPSTRKRVHEALVAKCAARGVPLHPGALDGPEIRRRAARDYPTLGQDTKQPLPEFEGVWSGLRQYFDELPWPAS